MYLHLYKYVALYETNVVEIASILPNNFGLYNLFEDINPRHVKGRLSKFQMFEMCHSLEILDFTT